MGGVKVFQISMEGERRKSRGSKSVAFSKSLLIRSGKYKDSGRSVSGEGGEWKF
jgi:hypothetical protein